MNWRFIYLQKPLQKPIVMLFLLMLALFFFLIGCTNESELAPKSENQPNKGNSHAGKSEKDILIPINVPDGEFSKAIGWINDEHIIYVSSSEDGENVYDYNFSTGKSNLLLTTEFPVINISIGPTKDVIAIHTAPSTYEGVITVIDTNGHVIWSHALPSFELSMEWNPYDRSELFVVSFNEDWSFKTFLLLPSEKKSIEISLPQPFIKWLNHDEIAFLNWDDANPNFFAPLILKNIRTGEERLLFKEIYQFTSGTEHLITITIDQNEASKAAYTFYDLQFNPLTKFTVPQLSRYSDWVVPFNDYHPKLARFLTFIPLRSGEADTYKEGFELLAFDIKNRRETVLFHRMENEPLNCSPSGELCLYGYQFEKLLNLDKRTNTSLKEH